MLLPHDLDLLQRKMRNALLQGREGIRGTQIKGGWAGGGGALEALHHLEESILEW